ncbi:MAG: DUF2316 family protein [Lachnospiraceae bacterium]|nr:DUF2316 family protein [Lachnospiraceae bacterium]
MLTPMQIVNTRNEFQENFRRLGAQEEEVLQDLQISKKEFYCVLNMKHADPCLVWMFRDYLEDKMNEKGMEMMPFTRLAEHTGSYSDCYETPWRNN